MQQQLDLFDPQPTTDHRRITIQDRFDSFHAANPWVLDALEKLTRDFIAKGHRSIGIGMLFEVLRSHYPTTVRTDEPWRLNNNFRSRYARVIVQRNPEWRPYFHVRTLRAE
ncbi:hypothetical protein [Embleya sp. NPDC059237]|uniref:hypothetical protein n=1 Tax=Embleya sp. NPDC059237 TaxID=3346784 RepID=UPI0036A153A3